MFRTFTFFFLVILMSCLGKSDPTTFSWDIENERILNNYRNDPSYKSAICWEADIKNINSRAEPFPYGIFPVPEYSLLDSTFNGLGNSGDWDGFLIQNKTVIYHTFYVNKNKANGKYIATEENEAIFTIGILTDTVDQTNFTHTNVDISSRNYPHIICQGFVHGKFNQVEFVSFLTADRREYAIVNMRLFDLRIGRILLLAPQKDGSLRSLQLESPITSSGKMNKYLEELFSNDEDVINFFTASGNIG